jgi:hypothetical protein
MARKYEKVLELMKNKNGRVSVDDAELLTLLGRLKYRMASYMSGIRRRAKLDVRAVRDGRKVVAYELSALTDTNTPVTTEEAPAANVAS